MSFSVEVIGGRHDGDTMVLPWKMASIKVPFVRGVSVHMWEEGDACPDLWAYPDLRQREYVLRPHPYRHGWGAVYAPDEWGCSKRDHRRREEL